MSVEIANQQEKRGQVRPSLSERYRRVRETVLDKATLSWIRSRFLPKDFRDFIGNNREILGQDYFRNWEDIENFLESQIPRENGQRKRIVDRCNWQAELERAAKLRSSRSEFAYEHLGYEQLKEFRTCIDTLYREFCLVEREYSYSRKVVRKKVGDTYLYKIVAFDPNDPVQATESSDHAFSRAGLVGMLNRGIEFSSIPERDIAYKEGFLKIYKNWIAEFDSAEEGSVHLHISPPPSTRSAEMREGYGTHTFQNWNISERIDENTLLIHVVNLRTEYSLENQLHMLAKSLQGDDLELNLRMLNLLKRGGDIDLHEILRFPMKLSGFSSEGGIRTFLDERYLEMGDSDEVNLRNKDAYEREMRYLLMCLTNEDIQEIRTKLEPIQELYVKALLSGAPISSLKTIVNYLEHSANVLYAQYKYQRDVELGIVGTTFEQYLAIAIANNGKGNDACPIQVDSGESIILVDGGEIALVNGERVQNPFVTCPDKECKHKFRVYEKGKQHKTCPNCGWDPCDPEKTGATYKNRLLLKSKMEKERLKEVRVIEPENLYVVKPRKIVVETEQKPVILENQVKNRFRYVVELDMYYQIIFGQTHYYSSHQVEQLLSKEAVDFS